MYEDLRGRISPETKERFLNKIMNPSAVIEKIKKKHEGFFHKDSPTMLNKQAIMNSSVILPPPHRPPNREAMFDDIKTAKRSKLSKSSLKLHEISGTSI